MSINEVSHTLESISSVTKEEPLYITTVLSVPATIFGTLIVWPFMLIISPDALPKVTAPRIVVEPSINKSLLPEIVLDTVNVPSRSTLSLKSIVLPPVFDSNASA